MPTLSDFAGDWLLHRTIDDRAAREAGDYRATATFLPDGNEYDYAETGLLKIANRAPLSATRHYRWRAQGPLIAVDFADGSPFHSFDPTKDHPTDRHACAPDLYQVSYDFTRWPNWQATWIVRGPRKDYTSVSTYSRDTQ